MDMMVDVVDHFTTRQHLNFFKHATPVIRQRMQEVENPGQWLKSIGHAREGANEVIMFYDDLTLGLRFVESYVNNVDFQKDASLAVEFHESGTGYKRIKTTIVFF